MAERDSRLLGIKAILIDWDDTAVETFETVFELYQSFALLSQLDAPSLEDLKRLWGMPVIKILAGLWPLKNPHELYSDFITAVPKDHAVRPFPWLEQTMFLLADAQFVLGVVSSTPKKAVELTQKKYSLNLDLYFHFQTGDDSLFHKPDRRIFDEVGVKLANLGIGEDKVLYVGDGLNDYEAAKARGLLFRAVTTGFTTTGEFVQSGLDRNSIFDNLSQLPEKLGLWVGNR